METSLTSMDRLMQVYNFLMQATSFIINIVITVCHVILTEVAKFSRKERRVDRPESNVYPRKKKSVGFSDTVKCKTIMETEDDGYDEILSTLNLNDIEKTTTKSSRRVSYSYIPPHSDSQFKSSSGVSRELTNSVKNRELQFGTDEAKKKNKEENNDQLCSKEQSSEQISITKRERKDSLAIQSHRQSKNSLCQQKRHKTSSTLCSIQEGNEQFAIAPLQTNRQLNDGKDSSYNNTTSPLWSDNNLNLSRPVTRRRSVMVKSTITKPEVSCLDISKARRPSKATRRLSYFRENNDSRSQLKRQVYDIEHTSMSRRSSFHNRRPSCFQDTFTNRRSSIARRDSIARKPSFSRRGSHVRKQSVVLRRQSIKHVSGTHYFWNKVKQIRYVPQKIAEFKELFSQNAHNVLLSKYETNGPVYEITALGKRMVFLFEYSYLSEIKKVEGNHPEHVDFKHLRTYRQKNGLPLGVLVSTGKDWSRQRKILSKAIGGTLAMKKYNPTVQTVAKETVDYIRREFCKPNSVFQARAFTGNYAAEAFGQVMYGMELGCLYQNPSSDMHKFVGMVKNNFQDAKVLMALPSWLYPCSTAWRNHSSRWDFLLQTTQNNIEKSRQCLMASHSPSILSTLLQNRSMTDPEVRVNFTDLMTASVDTTSNLLQWCLFEVGKSRGIQDRIVQEVNACVNKTGHVIPDRLLYLQAVVKETLRLYPVGFFTSRITQKDLKLCGHSIPAKTHVAVSMYVLGRDKSLFPEPGVFNPDRWLKGDSKLDRFFKDVPFGFGPRMCLGRRVAELIVYQFIAHFCLELEFETMDVEIQPCVRLLLVPNKPVEFLLRARGSVKLSTQRRQSFIHRLFRH